MLYSIPQAIFLIICIWERSLKWVISEETQIKMENSLYKCVQNIWSLIYNSWNAFLLSQNCYYSKVMLSTYNVLCFLVFILQPNQSLFICKYASSKCIAFIRVSLTKLIQISASHCFFHPNISYFIYGSAFPNAPCGPNSYCVQEKYGYYGWIN